MKKINSNKGMYIEMLVEKTILYYLDNKICFLEKRNLPIQIIKKNNNLIFGKLLDKSYVDFFGFINSKFITFETKQTNKDYFDLKRIQKHQLEYLNLMNEFNVFSFVIVHFFNFEKTILIPTNTLFSMIKNKKNKIFLNSIQEYILNNEMFELNIVFPGVLDLYEKITLANCD